MSQIEVSVYDQTAYFNHTPDIFSGDVDVDTVKFIFDDTWNDFNDKTAVFYNDPKKSYPVMLNDDNTVIIPKTVINRECTLYFGVMGANGDGKIKTSSILSYRIARGVISADTEVLPPNVDVWLQILANYEFALERLADMNNTLADMNNTLAEIDARIIESAQENKANINLNNLTNDANTELLSRVNMDTILNGKNYFKLPYKVKCGTVTTTNNSGEVVFDTPFTEAPFVMVTAECNSSGSISAGTLVGCISTKDITAEGFTVMSTSTASSGMNFKVHWMAIGV